MPGRAQTRHQLVAVSSVKMFAKKVFLPCAVALLALACIVQAKIYERKSDPYSTDRGTDPKWNTRQYNQTQDPVQPAETSADQRTERLGGYSSTGYGSVSGYPHSGAGGGVGGYYSPLKFNIGGIIVGTLVGVGALLLLPKLASAFHGGGSSNGYYRSDDSASDFTQLMQGISNFMDDNRVDSAACVKRMICSSVRNSEFNLENQTADQIDQWINGLAE